MFYLRKNSFNFSYEWLARFFHFLRLHQLVYQLTLVTIILFFSPQSSLFQILSAFGMIVLITPSFLLIQDILGKKDDEKFGQKRIIFSDRANKVFFYSFILVMLIILLLNNILSLICYLLLFFSTICYAATKHFRKMYLSYLFRYLSSLFTFLMYFFILVGSFSEKFIFLIVFVSVLDLVGNIAGDIRDGKKDALVGVKTFLTTKGRSYTLQIMSLLVICIFSILIIEYKSFFFILLLIANIFPFLLIEQLPVRFSHGIFHLLKLINYLCLSFVLSGIGLSLFCFVLTFIVVAWIFSYYFYLLYSVH